MHLTSRYYYTVARNYSIRRVVEWCKYLRDNTICFYRYVLTFIENLCVDYETIV